MFSLFHMLTVRAMWTLAGIVLCGVCAGHAMTGDEVWQQFSANPTDHNNIPDCSRAGYARGEVPLPHIPQVTTVTDFGASTAAGDNTGAFQAAIDHAAAMGGGAVYVPEGHWEVDGILFLHSSGVVLRGDSTAASVIEFTNGIKDVLPPTSEDTYWNWAGGFIWVGPTDRMEPGRAVLDWDVNDDNNTTINEWEYWDCGPDIASVSGEYERGDSVLTVDNSATLSVGQLIILTWDLDNDCTLPKEIYGPDQPYQGDKSDAGWHNADWLKPRNFPHFQWPVYITRIQGDAVTLSQPLRVHIRDTYNVTARTPGNMVTHCGVEHLTLYAHAPDKDPALGGGEINDALNGYNGIYFNRAVDCWARDIDLQDMEVGIGTSASKNITVRDFTLSMSAEEKTVHHATANRVYSHDILWTGFTIAPNSGAHVYHGINTEWMSSGCVWSDADINEGTFDSHHGVSFDIIRTNIDIVNNGTAGGSYQAGPFLGRRAVNWNVYIDPSSDQAAQYIFHGAAYPDGAFVGIRGQGYQYHFQGDKYNYLDMSDPGPHGYIIADSMQTPAIADLHLRQRQRRLEMGNAAFVQLVSPAHHAQYTAAGASVTARALTATYGSVDVDEVAYVMDGSVVATSSDAANDYAVHLSDPGHGPHHIYARADLSNGARVRSMTAHFFNGTLHADTIDDRDSRVSYDGGAWSEISANDAWQQTLTQLQRKEDGRVSLMFTGTKLRCYLRKNKMSFKPYQQYGWTVYIDDTTEVYDGGFLEQSLEKDASDEPIPEPHHLLFETDWLEPGSHEVTIAFSCSTQMGPVEVDYFVAYNHGEHQVDTRVPAHMVTRHSRPRIHTAQTHLVIQGLDGREHTLSLHTPSGRCVFSHRLQRDRVVNLPAMGQGAYLVRLDGPSGHTTRRICILR